MILMMNGNKEGKTLKQNKPPINNEQKSNEHTCRACEGLGLTEIVQELIANAEQEDKEEEFKFKKIIRTINDPICESVINY